MPSSDVFFLQRLGLNEFLFAPVGTEANGMTLSVASVFARLGNDPWLEAGRLARLPKSEATDSLARSIASMPTSIWPLHAATEIAARLIVMLPTQSYASAIGPAAPRLGAKVSRLFPYVMVLVCLACVLAYQTCVVTTPDAAKTDGNSVAGSTASPPR